MASSPNQQMTTMQLPMTQINTKKIISFKGSSTKVVFKFFFCFCFGAHLISLLCHIKPLILSLTNCTKLSTGSLASNRCQCYSVDFNQERCVDKFNCVAIIVAVFMILSSNSLLLLLRLSQHFSNSIINSMICSRFALSVSLLNKNTA